MNIKVRCKRTLNQKIGQKREGRDAGKRLTRDSVEWYSGNMVKWSILPERGAGNATSYP
jgi:hypothetical protein